MKVWTKALCLFLSLLLLTSCWDFERLEERLIISGIAIDKKGDGYTIAIEYLASGGSGGKQTGGKQTKVSKVDVTVPSVEIPLHSIQSKLKGEPFYANLQLLIIGRKKAEAGIANIISHFIRDPDMRRTTEVVIAEQPFSLFDDKESNSEFLSQNVMQSLKLTDQTGRTISSNIGDISRSIHEKSVLLMPYITAGEKKGEVLINGTAVLKDGKWIYHINDKDSRMVGFVKGSITHGSYLESCPENKGVVALDIIKTSPSLEPRVKDGKLEINGKVEIKSHLAEYTCDNGSVEQKTRLKVLRKDIEKKLSEDINRVIKEAYQNKGVDLLDLKGELQKNDPTQWENIKDQFDKMVKTAKVNIKTELLLKLKGSET